MKHSVRHTEWQDLVITPAGHVAYDLQHMQYRCTCGWHTDPIEVSVATQDLRTRLRGMAHEHAKNGAL